MKKKGFTLIELLAVIVILAIIALIATPIVMNTIENSKKGAAERSAENYMDAVETAVAEERIDNVILEGEYTIQSDGSLCPKAGCGEDDKDKVSIEMSGNKPISGTIFIENGLVTTNSTMTFTDNYEVSYDSTKGSYVANKAGQEDENTSVVVYSWSVEPINIGDIIDPTDTTKFIQDPSTFEKNYYLKHVLDNDNKIIESWVCAHGTCVRGGNTEFYGYASNPNDYTGNALILKGLQEQDKDLNCFFNEDDSSCGNGSINLDASSSGGVTARDEFDYCYVGGNGSSFCEKNS